MITAFAGFMYWLGGQGQLDLWTCNPAVAWVMVLVGVLELVIWTSYPSEDDE